MNISNNPLIIIIIPAIIFSYCKINLEIDLLKSKGDIYKKIIVIKILKAILIILLLNVINYIVILMNLLIMVVNIVLWKQVVKLFLGID